MKTREEKIKEQIQLSDEIVGKASINLVNCGNCGDVLLHRVIPFKKQIEDNYEIECPYCDFKSDPCDFPDFFYEGLELSAIWKED